MIDLLHPWALVLLIPMVLWIAVLRRGHALGLALLPGGWAAAVQPGLQRSIARHLPAPKRGWQRGAILGCWTLLIAALAHPVIQLSGPAPIANLAGRVLVLDLGAPTALIREKLTASALLARTDLPTALVASTGDAYTAVPLTLDRQQIERYLNVLEPDLMPDTGQSLPLALAHAENMLEASGVSAGQIVLITGGAAPTVSDTLPPPRFLRAVVALDAQPEAWEPAATALTAELVDPDDLENLDASLDSEIDTLRNRIESDRQVDLSRWCLLLAVLCWLALFRREGAR